MASYLMIAVILLRLVLKKAPKWSLCLLWALVAIRLVLPLKIESRFSLLPDFNLVQEDKSQTADVSLAESGQKEKGQQSVF